MPIESRELIHRIRTRYEEGADVSRRAVRIAESGIDRFVDRSCGRWEDQASWIAEHLTGLAEAPEEAGVLADGSGEPGAATRPATRPSVPPRPGPGRERAVAGGETAQPTRETRCGDTMEVGGRDASPVRADPVAGRRPVRDARDAEGEVMTPDETDVPPPSAEEPGRRDDVRGSPFGGARTTKARGAASVVRDAGGTSRSASDPSRLTSPFPALDNRNATGDDAVSPWLAMPLETPASREGPPVWPAGSPDARSTAVDHEARRGREAEREWRRRGF